MIDLSEAVAQLGRPFTPAAIRIKPQTVTKSEPRKGLVTFYIDARLVVARLNHVVGAAAWSDAYEVLSLDPNTGLPTECRLSVLGVTKADIGQIEPGGFDNKAFKSAYSDALKRAAVKFNIGAYLYNLPQVWASVQVGANGKVRGFSDAGRAEAMKAYSAWLASPANIYGEPLDHGDVEHRVGVDEEAPVEVDDAGPFLIDGAPRGEDAMKVVGEMQQAIDPTVDWKDLAAQMVLLRYGVARSELAQGEFRDFTIRWINSITGLSLMTEGGDFPPVAEDAIIEMLANWFEGIVPSEVPRLERKAADGGATD
jgi:hypothetical protein